MRGLLAAIALSSSVAACSPAIEGVDEAALADGVGRAIGDPNTCVLLVNRAAEVVWRYGTHMTCARSLPSCEGDGVTTVDALGEAAARGDKRAISCPSQADGSTTVGWASGPVVASEGAVHEPLFFAAVMEGDRALPGREIQTRLENVFADVGL
ncbi:MAG TPA: hypothetical protein VD906_12045 [Caulobacteraceae bacterium]|nr:hypothetical protein [Caulobacteraceae bacterium]